LAIGAHGLRRAGISEKDIVLVIGAGPIGLGTMELARLSGAHVIALDTNMSRLTYCKNHFDIQHTLQASDQNINEQLKEITDGDMPSVVIDATGNLQAINNAFQYMAHGGTYVLIGLQKGDIHFSHPEFHKREGTLISSRNATWSDFEHVKKCLSEHKIRPQNYITHKTSFEHILIEFPTWLDPKSQVIKAIVEIA
jgi:threonine dehydrogenase-like Zn-dependent dehydrogenase